MPYSYDDERAPLVYMRLHGWVKDSELQQLLDDTDVLLGREREFAAVLDCEGLRVPELEQLRKLAGWFSTNFEAASRYHCGCACVITSPLVRGSLATILQMQRMPMPLTMLGSGEEAISWALAKLRDRAAQAKDARA